MLHIKIKRAYCVCVSAMESDFEFKMQDFEFRTFQNTTTTLPPKKSLDCLRMEHERIPSDSYLVRFDLQLRLLKITHYYYLTIYINF